MILSAIIILIMMGVLISEKIDPIKTLVITISIFLLLGTITIDEVTVGLTNNGVLSIAALFVIVKSVEMSSIFKRLTSFDQTSKTFSSIKFYGLIGSLSMFLYNAPLVSMFIPITSKLAKHTKIPVSKLLIPLSYVALLGGTLTLIGSSTNLIASGVLESYGYDPIAFWELFLLAIPSVVLGFAYIVIFHKKILPDTSKTMNQSRKEVHQHMIRFIVDEHSVIIGKNIVDAKLRNLEGLYLSDIERQGVTIHVSKEILIQKNDVLVFTGLTNKLDDLRKIKGLKLETDHNINTNYFDNDQTTLIEVIVTQNIGNGYDSIKKLNFRNVYDAIVIGVIREGRQLNEKTGNIVPKLGDILLLIVDKDKEKLIKDNYSFTVINQEQRAEYNHTIKSYVPIAVLLGTIVVSAFLNIDILNVSLIGIAILLATNTISPRQALNSINFRTIALLVLSISLGTIIVQSGIADYIAQVLVPIIGESHPVTILLMIFIIIALFTLILSNNSVVVIMIPIIISLISLTSYELRPFLLVSIIAASATYLSPYSYQTNIMVYGAGGYQYKDFIKFGLPLLLIVMVSTIISAYVLFFI